MSPADDSPLEDAADGSARDYATRDQLRAMAHPLRLEIMDRVGRRGTARAADVAADLDIPANSVSYHLRILARGGAIEEAPEAARDRRDRVWRLAQIAFQHDRRRGIGVDPHSADGEYLEASGATSLAAFEMMRAAWSAELARVRAPEVAPEDGLGSMIATSVRLSREQMRELNTAVIEKVQEYSRINRDERGADLAADPASQGEALTFRLLWASVGEPTSRRGADGSAAG